MDLNERIQMGINEIHGEMDKACVSMVAVMSFKGSHTVFLTVSPSNIDSKVARTIACRNSQNMAAESYN